MIGEESRWQKTSTGICDQVDNADETLRVWGGVIGNLHLVAKALEDGIDKIDLPRSEFVNIGRLPEQNGGVRLLNTRIAVNGADRIFDAFGREIASFSFHPLQVKAHPQGVIKTAIDKCGDQHLQADIADGALDDECGMRKQRGLVERRIDPAETIAGLHFRNKLGRYVPGSDITLRQRDRFADISGALFAQQIRDLVAQELHAG